MSSTCLESICTLWEQTGEMDNRQTHIALHQRGENYSISTVEKKAAQVRATIGKRRTGGRPPKAVAPHRWQSGTPRWKQHPTEAIDRSVVTATSVHQALEQWPPVAASTPNSVPSPVPPTPPRPQCVRMPVPMTPTPSPELNVQHCRWPAFALLSILSDAEQAAHARPMDRNVWGNAEPAIRFA